MALLLASCSSNNGRNGDGGAGDGGRNTDCANGADVLLRTLLRVDRAKL